MVIPTAIVVIATALTIFIVTIAITAARMIIIVV
jgi:hypothetical protein